MSGGRMVLGVGAGWMKEEFDVLGVPFEDRGKRTDEYIRALRVLWGDASPTFEGDYVSFKDTFVRPQPVNRSIPIHVGGHTDRAARRAGELGDGFFPGASDHETLEHCIGLMRQIAEKNGRNPSTIEVTAGGAMDPAGIEKLQALGVDRVLIPPLAMDNDGIRAALERFRTDVISKFDG